MIQFIKIYNTRISILPKPTPTPASISEFKQILQLTKKLTNKNNSKLYFIYLPEYGRYTNYYNTSKIFKKKRKKSYNLVKNIVTELKIPFIDIHKEVFETEQNPLKLFPFELDGHYNVQGYKKVAKIIYKFSKD